VARTRDREATIAKLLEAATAEFAEHGIAGARVERIAQEAGVNKALIFHYFESKDGLFDAVFAELVKWIVATAPLDATDLPGYAVALSRGAAENPQALRLHSWYRLERGDPDHLIESVVASGRDKVAAIRRAQKEGLVSDRFTPAELLVLITHLSMVWETQDPEHGALVRRTSRKRRDDVVRQVVASLTAP